MKISIIIPAYNEERNLKRGVLKEVEDYLQNAKFSYEVVIVDDGSNDSTVSLVEELTKGKANWRILKEPHGGKAKAVMKGILDSRGEITLFTDMDQATPLNQIEKFLPKFEQGFDIVIGQRAGREGAPALRKLTAWGFAFFRNIILGLPFTDTQCGFKAFNSASREAVFSKMREEWEKIRVSGAAVNAGFDVEVLFLANKMGFKIAEVPVIWHYVGTKRVNLISDSLEAIKDMIRIKYNDLTGKY